jgi:hypothetical protein
MRALLSCRLSWTLLVLACAAACGRQPERGQAIIAAYDEIAAADLWPGFAPDSLPLAVYDGRTTYLVRHPDPPAEFAPVAGRPDLWSYDGHHEAVRANTSTEIGGALSATLLGGSDTTHAPATLAAVLLHEAFHVYQRQKHPAWQANEVELFVYPVEDAGLLAERRLETEALRRALGAHDETARACWAGRALALREARYADMTEGSIGYERGSELNEGLARYIQTRVSAEAQAVLPEGRTFAADDVRARAYAVGAGFAELLDALAPDWKTRLARGTATSLDELLRDVPAVERAAGCAVTADERTTARERAEADIAELLERRAALRSEFMAAAGPRLVIEAADDALLWPERFDPSNVRRLSATEVLHARWLVLGNGGSRLEVLDRSALSEGVGPHPLFNGVRRLTVTGLAGEPTVREAEGALVIEAAGFEGTFHDARLERDSTTLVVRLGAEPSD